MAGVRTAEADAPRRGIGASSTEAPPARRVSAARWTDRRVLVGAFLVLCSVAGVLAVVSASNHTDRLWVYQSDLAPGSQVTADDVELAAVKVPNPETYLASSRSPVGLVTTGAVQAGELVTVGSVIGEAGAPATRLVTLPVERHHLPLDLVRGEVVDVYEVARGASGEPVGSPRLVLPEVTVADVDDADSRFGGSSLELGVALSVQANDVAKLVAAEADGTITLVRVPSENP